MRQIAYDVNVTASLTAAEVEKATFAAWFILISLRNGFDAFVAELEDLVAHPLRPAACATFVEAAEATLCACGGDLPSFLAGNNYTAWLESGGRAPAPIPWSQRLVPLTELEPDLARRGVMADELQAYINGTSAAGRGAPRAGPRGGGVAGGEACGCLRLPIPLTPGGRFCNGTAVGGAQQQQQQL